MPSIKDQSTVNKIAEIFCGEGKRNKTQTLVKAGYTHGYADGQGQTVVFGNNRIIKAIKAIDTKNSQGIEHNRQIAIVNLYTDYEYLSDKAAKGDIQAIQARTSIQRELDAISALHVSTVNTDTDKAHKQFTDTERDKLQGMAKELTKPKLAKNA